MFQIFFQNVVMMNGKYQITTITTIVKFITGF